MLEDVDITHTHRDGQALTGVRRHFRLRTALALCLLENVAHNDFKAIQFGTALE